MKKIALGILITIAIIISIIISSQLLGLHWLDKCLTVSESHFPLWASLGVIISALMAVTSSSLTIDNTNLQKISDLNKQKVSELKYVLHVLVKIKKTFSLVLKSIENNKFNEYSNEALQQMRQDIFDMSKKIDSKELFYFLSYDNAGKTMNIIARLHSIAFSLERDKNNRNLMEQEINKNLVNHKSGNSLLPFLEDVIQSIGQELQKIEHKPNL